jgi:hypothetical protein
VSRFSASELDQEAADRILERLVEGVPGGDGKPASLASILRAARAAGEAMPSWRTVFRWLHAFPEFAAAYARAREEQAEAIFDEILDVADDAGDDPQSRRVRIDARKWALGRMLPKRFGDRLAVTGGDGGPLEIEHAVEIDALDALLDRVQAREAPEGGAP